MRYKIFKTFRQHMAEKICEENPLVDIDKAYVIANQIFDDAAAGNLHAKRKLKSYVNSFYAFNRGKKN